MGILHRIRAHGGDATREEWRVRLRPGRLPDGLRDGVAAAEQNKPAGAVHDLGAGEHHVGHTVCALKMPPEQGDWNDHQQAHGLRPVALLLREVRPP